MISDNAKMVLEKRYFIKDKDGKVVEDWEQLCRRVAKEIAVDEKEMGDKYFELMYNLKFIPNTPTLVNAGRNNGQGLMACYVLPIHDNMKSIMQTATNLSLIQKGGGGTGFSFSELRSEDSRVNTTSGVASGPVSFMRMYNAITQEIRQGGTRRGANMSILNIDHPDILKFIDCKQDVTKLTNFNISVAITKDFMVALKNNKPYDLIDPHTKKVVGQLNAKDVFDKICKNTWQTGEPGLFFIDRVNEDAFSSLDEKNKIISPNPCVVGSTLIATVDGDITIKELAEKKEDVLVYSWNPKTKLPEINWMRDIRLTRKKAECMTIQFDYDSNCKLMCTRDHSLFSHDDSKIKVEDLKIGQKVRTFGTSNYLEVTSITLTGTTSVYNGVVDNAHTYIVAANDEYSSGPYGGIVSANCGETPLRAYEACTLGSFNLVKYVNGKFNFNKLKADVKLGTRFLDSVITRTPYVLPEIKKTHGETRKIGLGIMGLANVFALLDIEYGSDESFKLASKIYKTVHDASYEASEELGKEKGVCDACKQLGESRRNLWTTVIAPTGSISLIAGCSSGIEPIFNVAYERTCLDGTKMNMIDLVFEQVMKENNIELTDDRQKELISTDSIKDIKWVPAKLKRLFPVAGDIPWKKHVEMQAALQAHTDGAVSKTINLSESATVEDVKGAYLLAYESGCKGITAYRNNSRPEQVLAVKKEVVGERKKYNRVATLTGETRKIKTELGNLLLTINKNKDGNPIEVILNIGRSGADIDSFCESLGRIISLALQWGIPLSKIAKQLKGIRGEDVIFHSQAKYTSIPDLLGRVIGNYEVSKEESKTKKLGDCSICGSKLYWAEGCSTCLTCGASKC